MNREELCRKLLDAWGNDTDELLKLIEIIANVRARMRRELITGWAVGFRNAAYTVRQDGGSEERALAFEDAAGILEYRLKRLE